MVCTFVDVVGRYVFNSPLPGALELTEIMMASLIFTILPVVSARSDHITVDLLVLPRSSMLRRIQNLAINVDRKSTRLNSSNSCASRMPSSACKKKNNKQHHLN